MFLTANIFQPLIDVFEAVLKFFHNNVGVSWGFSIVLLTIVIRALLLPLTIKQFHSMQRMQRLQPEIKALQTKYKNDKQRQQQEMMKFYRENQVNPFASCLPLVAQLPVFIGLFYMLRQSLRKDICPGVQAAYKANYMAVHHVSAASAAGHTTYCTDPQYAHYYHGGAGFLFIPDLTNKATGAVLIALIVLYVGTQLGSSLMMSTSTMDKTQRQIMLFLPLVFVFIIIGFPAGLIVYWITTNAWTIAQQYIVRKRVGPMGPVPAAATAGASSGGGEGRGGGGGGGGPEPEPVTNGSGQGGGLGALLRGRTKQAEPAAVGANTRTRRSTAPPPPPRKKKKRSGRRR